LAGAIDPMATPGISAIDSQGIPNIAGAPASANGQPSSGAPKGADDAEGETDRPPLLRFTPAKAAIGPGASSAT